MIEARLVANSIIEYTDRCIEMRKITYFANSFVIEFGPDKVDFSEVSDTRNAK